MNTGPGQGAHGPSSLPNWWPTDPRHTSPSTSDVVSTPFRLPKSVFKFYFLFERPSERPSSPSGLNVESIRCHAGNQTYFFSSTATVSLDKKTPSAYYYVVQDSNNNIVRPRQIVRLRNSFNLRRKRIWKLSQNLMRLKGMSRRSEGGYFNNYC